MDTDNMVVVGFIAFIFILFSTLLLSGYLKDSFYTECVEKVKDKSASDIRAVCIR